MKYFLAAACGFAFLAITAAQSFAAVGDNPGLACHTADELSTHVYAPADKMVSYAYAGKDAAAIIDAFATILGPPPGNPVTVVLAYATVAGAIDFWLYDVAGCFVAHTDNFDLESTKALFDALDITLPIGSTFYQIPGLHI